MASTKGVEPLDELADEMARMSPAENEFLWRIRELNQMGPHEYLDFLLQFSANRSVSRETTPDDIQPFEL